ncbi:Mu-like prophage I protein [Flavonifractor plautii]|nr:Mu-like prophage I protein [Flavonifractor plautii]
MKDYLILKGGQMAVGDGVPEVIPVLPLGHVVSSKGEFDVDEESFQAMKAQIAQRGVDLVVDYEHQTLKGVEAPAAGWVKELKLEGGQIMAVVQWTPRGAQYLENKEYRYLSPVVTVRRSDGKATGLHSLALTNTPAIEHMTPIVNSDLFEGGQHIMDIQKLAELLGLGTDATEEQILESLKACVDENKSLKAGAQPPADDSVVANKTVCELVGLKAGAPVADVTAKIMELKSGKIDGVDLKAEIKALKQQNAERDADAAVDLALKSGKITPAQKDWARQYALDNPTGFASFVEKAPQVVPMGELMDEGTMALKGGTLDEATMLVCKQLGLDPEDVKKYNLKEG